MLKLDLFIKSRIKAPRVNFDVGFINFIPFKPSYADPFISLYHMEQPYS